MERNPERSARRATLSLWAMPVTIEVSRHHRQLKQCQPVTLNALLVEEDVPPREGKPIR